MVQFHDVMTMELDAGEAERLWQARQPAEAAAQCEELLRRDPDNARALLLLGVIRMEAGNHAEAIELLGRSAGRAPSAIAFRNLGLALDGAGRTDEAIRACEQAVRLQPDYADAHNTLGHCYASQGLTEEAVASFRRALEIAPGLSVAVENLLPFMPIEAWAVICNAGLGSGVSRRDAYTFLAYRAAAEWATGWHEELDGTIAAAGTLRAALDPADDAGNDLVLLAHCRLLIDLKRRDPRAYAGKPEATIFTIGDPHSLSYCGTVARLGGAQARLRPHNLIRSTAWMISGRKPNRHLAAIDHLLGLLPRESQVALSFGELDCRTNAGILPRWQKTGGSLADLVRREVEAYVGDMAGLAVRHGHRLHFFAVPAPQRETPYDRQSTPRQRALLAQVVRLFNESLRTAALARACGVIDVYAATAGPDGFANGKLHIDAIHLAPSVIPVTPVHLPAS